MKRTSKNQFNISQPCVMSYPKIFVVFQVAETLARYFNRSHRQVSQYYRQPPFASGHITDYGSVHRWRIEIQVKVFTKLPIPGSGLISRHCPNYGLGSRCGRSSPFR